MKKLSTSLQFLLDMARAQAVLSRRFDSRLGGGIGFSDFMILYQISQSPDEKIRRSDLAEQIGLTASGVTRLLAPMEKIGLVSRHADPHDARVSYVSLAAGGKRILSEKLEKAELLAEEIIESGHAKTVSEVTKVLQTIR